MSDTRKIGPDDDLLRQRISASAATNAARTRPWPALEQAVRRDVVRRRVRSGASLAVVFAVALAAVLPFTPVRVAPLDKLADTIGLRDADHDDGSLRQRAPLTPAPTTSAQTTPAATTPVPTATASTTRASGHRPLQRVVRSADKRVEATGKPLPAPGGTPVTDEAWLNGAVERAKALIVVDDASYRTGRKPQVWANDDGVTRRAVVVHEDEVDEGRTTVDWAVLSGPTGAAPEQLTLSSTDHWLSSPKDPRAPAFEPGLVAYATAPGKAPARIEVSGVPSVGADGVMTRTWHRMTEVRSGVWVGDLGPEGRAGVALRDQDGRVLYDAWAGYRQWEEPPLTFTAAEVLQGLLDYSPLGSVAGLGYAGAVSEQTLTTKNGGGDFRVTLDVDIIGIRSPGGGWLVTGTAGSAEFGEPETVSLPIEPAPGIGDGGTPFVGLAQPEDDVDWDNYHLFFWAPPEIVTVRSGSMTARVQDGIAVLEVAKGGDVRFRRTPKQEFLFQGLDARGKVVARTWVAWEGWRGP